MENRINIAELLKDCPNDMELDCVMYGVVKIEYIDLNNECYPISIETKSGFRTKLTKYGQNVQLEEAKCVIFPKGKTTWDGFQRPFKDGDILSYQYKGFKNRTIYIYMYHNRMNTTYYVALSGNSDSEFMINYKEGHALNSYNDTVRFATEEEKQKLFKAIKDNGYKWNAETKTLDKLIEPKFKVGDKIKHKYNNTYCTLGEYSDGISAYRTNIGLALTYKDLEHWELVPDKFDINTLEIFKSKVLVRDNKDENWKPAIFGGFKKERNIPYVVVGGVWFKYLIPYEGNEHLLLSKNDCDEFYKTWE